MTQIQLGASVSGVLEDISELRDGPLGISDVEARLGIMGISWLGTQAEEVAAPSSDIFTSGKKRVSLWEGDVIITLSPADGEDWFHMQTDGRGSWGEEGGP